MADQHHQKLNPALSQQQTNQPPPSSTYHHHHLNPNQQPTTAPAPATSTTTTTCRPSTPSRFLTSSPLPPASSAYALVSLTRKLGTPTSDLRATSPSSRLNYNPPDSSSSSSDPLLKPSAHSSSSPADWSHPPDDQLFLHSDYPPRPAPAALPGVHNLLHRTHQSCCFWAILDDQLKLVFLDPSLFPTTTTTKADEQARSQASLPPLDQLIYPPHLARIRRDLIHLSPRLPIPTHPTDRSASSETLVGRSLCSSRTPVRCSFLRHAQLVGRLLLPTTDSNYCPSESYPTESDDRYHPTDLLLHPIPHGRFLAFFHPQQQAPRPESHGNPPYSPWITSTTTNNNTSPSSAACGHRELDPDANYLSPEEVDQLHRALANSSSTTPPGFQAPPASSLETAAFSPADPLEIFLILDSRNARVLFSHHSPSTTNLSDYQFAPEDYAYFAMQSKQHRSADNEEGSTHSNCSRELTAQHRLVKDGTVINIVQSFVIEYGSVTFASFKSSLPLPASHHQTMINQPQQSTHPTMSSVKPSPLELVHDSRPIPLDLYSPTSSQLAHSAKRPRTDSSSEVLTPQSACSTQSQPYSYQRPSTHPGHQYSSFNSHHHHHHHHHPSPQLSSLTSSISMPESPDPYGGYGHFSGELSPTMASAANVLGSFHRAHYHHPQSILALQDSHHHHPHQISPASSTHHSSILGYENYGLQNLASMAASAPFDHPQSQPPPPPPPPDFSSQSSASSPHQPQSSSSDSYIIPSAPSSSQHLALNNRSFRPPPNQNKDSRLSTGSSSLPSPDPTTNESTLGCLIGLNHHHHDHYSSASNHEFGRPPPPPPPAELLSAPSYRSLTSSSSSVTSSSRDQQLPRSSSFIDNRFLKRPRSSQLDPLGSSTTTGTAVTSTANATHSDPAAVRSCTSCGAQNSPEWRKGPNGVKSLCNACGLRFSRAQARKSKAPKNSSNSASNQQQQQLKKQGHQLHHQQQQQQQQQQTMIGKKKLVHALPPPPPPTINAPSPNTAGTSAAAGAGTAGLPDHLLLVNDDPRLIIDGFRR